MRFAPVCPINIYEALREKSPQHLGTYFLLLAHDVLEHAERYNAFFANHPEYTIILDNSVIELGDACTAKNLMDAARILGGVACVAIPDVLEDGPATLAAGEQFLADWDDLIYETGFDVPKMFIPQGRNLGEWAECLFLGRKFNASWVGIPRNTVPRIVASRRRLVELVVDSYPINTKIHLLGFSGDTADDVTLCNHPYIRQFVDGIDSAVPLRLTEPLTSTPQDPGPRGDWWETAQASELMFNNVVGTTGIRNLISDIGIVG